MLINPLSTLITANKSGNANNISNARCVLAVNGADGKRVVFLTDANDVAIGSFTLPKFAMVKIVKKSSDKLYAAENLQDAGNEADILVTFTSIGFTD
tara:strand:- start:124 stop:414 length:291 start_codon:yes stop_codon:yes gene_type:complete